LLHDLGALICIHPQLELNQSLLKQLRFLQRCLQRFDREEKLARWQIKLEVILAQLSPSQRLEVATNFQMSDDSIKRLSNLDDIQNQIISLFSTSATDSQIVKLLSKSDLATLILVSTKISRLIRQQIWRYLTILKYIQVPLNGTDLKNMGYKPSPQFKQILDDLLAATLNGVIIDIPSAQKYLAEHYPN
jgi:tRNA nucleotidyltransferase (CCA-adding enzyme)